MKQTSAKLAKLASQVLKGYEPTRDEIESLAASVLAQREETRAEKRRVAAEKIAAEVVARRKEDALVAMANDILPEAEAALAPPLPKQSRTAKARSWLSGLFKPTT